MTCVFVLSVLVAQVTEEVHAPPSNLGSLEAAEKVSTKKISVVYLHGNNFSAAGEDGDY